MQNHLVVGVILKTRFVIMMHEIKNIFLVYDSSTTHRVEKQKIDPAFDKFIKRKFNSYFDKPS